MEADEEEQEVGTPSRIQLIVQLGSILQDSPKARSVDNFIDIFEILIRLDQSPCFF